MGRRREDASGDDKDDNKKIEGAIESIEEGEGIGGKQRPAECKKAKLT